MLKNKKKEEIEQPEEEVKKTALYSVHTFLTTNEVSRFYFPSLDAARVVYNDLRNIVLSKSRLIMMNPIQESELTLPTTLVSLKVAKEEVPEDLVKEILEKSSSKDVKFLGN